ncbi:unnamed protein product [Cuscuta europaea]|uniref:Uncharacterized protein n=1 Tax=Cuscuta europaea TaxID=41803 RepID=A0A9P1EH50_CUSEU|nr:unnamed protein product [Cuscuta europaea]
MAQRIWNPSTKDVVEKALKRVESVLKPNYVSNNIYSAFGTYRLTKDVKEAMQDLKIELTWMKCFLLTGERTEHGKVVAAVWSSAIELLAGSEVHGLLGTDDRFQPVIINTTELTKNLCKKFANLRQMIQPFLIMTCLSHVTLSPGS